MFDITKIARFLPTIEKPTYKPPLNKKLLWTGFVLVIYYILSSQLFGHVYGVGEGAGRGFQTFQMLLGSKFGTLMTLGIGPIVTASIFLQLLTGSKIIDWDMTKPENREKFQAAQKILAVIFCIVESVAFVITGAVPPVNNSIPMIAIVVTQLAIGGFIIILLDEIVSKYGIGSGISLIIAAGVTESIFVGLFTPFSIAGGLPSAVNEPVGMFWRLIINLLGGNMFDVLANLLPIISTIVIFLIVIYTQGITVDIPLGFSSLRGFGRRWSLNLFYASVIPVILVSALLANMQMFGSMLAKPMADNPSLRCGILGCFRESPQGVEPYSGLVYYLRAPRNMLFNLITGSVTFKLILRALIYMSAMIIGCTIFSIFWINTSGMDAESIADQITSTGMQIPGYRRDPRIIKNVLSRYITPLTVIGGAAIGFLAAFADFLGAIGSGTGILLTVSIIYNFYEQLKRERIEEAHPAVRKVLGVD